MAVVLEPLPSVLDSSKDLSVLKLAFSAAGHRLRKTNSAVCAGFQVSTKSSSFPGVISSIGGNDSHIGFDLTYFWLRRCLHTSNLRLIITLHEALRHCRLQK